MKVEFFLKVNGCKFLDGKKPLFDEKLSLEVNANEWELLSQEEQEDMIMDLFHNEFELYIKANINENEPLKNGFLSYSIHGAKIPLAIEGKVIFTINIPQNWGHLSDSEENEFMYESFYNNAQLNWIVSGE